MIGITILSRWYEGSTTELSLGVRNPERDASDALDTVDADLDLRSLNLHVA
jgi:hypothetical protein